ncbi:hypothetical protein B0H13DRAFT_2372946 [Mycena leptocephala]|nr:hypothetical protein B0H13DRAFT_2372946 [Mycena leptocephala]
MASTKRLPVSLEGFRGQTRALVHLLVLPLVQRNVLKLEWWNELWDEQVKEFGFLPPEPIVVIAMESESANHLLAVFCDAEVQKVFDSGKELGLQRGGICTSSVDVIAKIDSASASPDGSGPSTP